MVGADNYLLVADKRQEWPDVDVDVFADPSAEDVLWNKIPKATDCSILLGWLSDDPLIGLAWHPEEMALLRKPNAHDNLTPSY